MKNISSNNSKDIKFKRVLMEIFGGCNYTCQMCPQSFPGRDKEFRRKIPIEKFDQILDKIVPKYGTPLIGLSGSGEATMAKDLDLYVNSVKNRGLKVFIYTNGERLSGDYMKKVIDAGIDFIRFSIIGYNKDVYKKWMNIDNFDLVKKNLKETIKYIAASKSNCLISTYHLICDNNKQNEELLEYKKLINELNCKGYVWKMHNMSGNFKNSDNPRLGKKKSSCGRPFAPELTVRAGGLDSKFGAVTACCQTLGPPNEKSSVMGHLDSESVEEIYFGKKYEELREAHDKKDFDKIDYCKNCDYLYEDIESLVWTNDKTYTAGQMLGVGSDFNLFNYNNLSTMYHK